MPVKSVVQQLTSMRNTMIYYSLLGKHKDYAVLRKEFAKVYVAHREEAEHIPRYNGRFSLFSYFGLNIAKIWFLELFRKKTPDEKLMKQYGRELMAKEKSGIYA